MANTVTITAQDLQGMVEHCLSTPPGGYLGSDYGVDTLALLQTPMSAGLADDLITKIRQDVPLIGQAPSGTVNIYSYQADFETTTIVVDVAGQGITLGSAQ